MKSFKSLWENWKALVWKLTGCYIELKLASEERATVCQKKLDFKDEEDDEKLNSKREKKLKNTFNRGQDYVAFWGLILGGKGPKNGAGVLSNLCPTFYGYTQILNIFLLGKYSVLEDIKINNLARGTRTFLKNLLFVACCDLYIGNTHYRTASFHKTSNYYFYIFFCRILIILILIIWRGGAGPAKIPLETLVGDTNCQSLQLKTSFKCSFGTSLLEPAKTKI